MPSELEKVQEQQMLQDREIRRLRLWLQLLAVAEGIRANKIIGIIDPGNLPSSAQGGLLVYVSFGSEPTGGQTHTTTVMYAGDIVVKT